jgi:hypothetical protein
MRGSMSVELYAFVVCSAARASLSYDGEVTDTGGLGYLGILVNEQFFVLQQLLRVCWTPIAVALGSFEEAGRETVEYSYLAISVSMILEPVL